MFFNSNVHEKYGEICHILHHFVAKDLGFQKTYCSALQIEVIGGERKQYTRTYDIHLSEIMQDVRRMSFGVKRLSVHIIFQ